MECPPCLTRMGTRGDEWRHGEQPDSPWGWSHTNNGAANGGGGHLILLKFVIPNHENITSVTSELCWSPLNSEKNSEVIL